MEFQKHSKRRHTVNEGFYKEEIGVERNHFIQNTKNELIFYNEFHHQFMTLNMADKYTLKEARTIINTLSEECEAVTLETIKKQFSPNPRKQK